MQTQEEKEERLIDSSDVIRDYQSKQLYEDFKLTPLFIYRTAISRSFKNQVMARLASVSTSVSERSLLRITRCAHYESVPIITRKYL